MSDERGSGVSGADVLMFFAEIAVYLAVGLAGWRVHPLLGVLAVGLMAVWWGLFHSPKARWPARGAARVLGVAAWFGVGVAASGWWLVAGR